MTEHLYGLQFAEDLHFDPADVVQQWLDQSDEDEVPDFIIEEWSVHPPRYHLPSTERLLEWIAEWSVENGEVAEGFEPRDGMGEAAKEASEALLDIIASGIKVPHGGPEAARPTCHPERRPRESAARRRTGVDAS